MAHDDKKECKFCDLVKMIWGYDNCGELITKLSINVLNAMTEESKKLLDELQAKKADGKIDDKNYHLMASFLRQSIVHSGAEFPAVIVAAGYCEDTMYMMEVSNDKLMTLIRSGRGVTPQTQELFAKLTDGLNDAVNKGVQDAATEDLPAINVAPPKKSSLN